MTSPYRVVPRQRGPGLRQEIIKSADQRMTDVRYFLSQLSLTMHKAHGLGLHATAQVIHDAVRKAGFEAEPILGKLEQTIENNLEKQPRKKKR